MAILTINHFYPANITAFEIDDEVLANLREYALANSLFWAMSEGHACEISVKESIEFNFPSAVANNVHRLVGMQWR